MVETPPTYDEWLNDILDAYLSITPAHRGIQKTNSQEQRDLDIHTDKATD